MSVSYQLGRASLGSRSAAPWFPRPGTEGSAADARARSRGGQAVDLDPRSAPRADREAIVLADPMRPGQLDGDLRPGPQTFPAEAEHEVDRLTLGDRAGVLGERTASAVALHQHCRANWRPVDDERQDRRVARRVMEGPLHRGDDR